MPGWDGKMKPSMSWKRPLRNALCCRQRSSVTHGSTISAENLDSRISFAEQPSPNRQANLAGERRCYPQSASALMPQTAPILCDHNGVSWVRGIVFDGGHQPGAAGVQVHAVAQAGHVLRGFVAHPGHVVLVNQQLDLRGAVRDTQLVDVDYSAVGDAANGADA